MITSKIHTPLRQLYIRHQRTRAFQSSERDGNAWMLGMYVLCAILMLFLLLINKLKMEEIVETVEDGLTTSALGGLVWDYRATAISHDYIVDDEDECYRSVCELLGDNLNISPTTINTYEGNDFISGTSKVTRIILYNVYSDSTIISYDYQYLSDGTYTKVKGSMNTTPQGEGITETSIYIEYEFPIRICGFTKEVKKGEYVAIEKE